MWYVIFKSQFEFKLFLKDYLRLFYRLLRVLIKEILKKFKNKALKAKINQCKLI